MIMQTNVYFDNGRKKQYAKLYLNSVGPADIEINEYEKIVIGLQSDDKEAILKVEVYDDDEIVTIRNGESKVLVEEGYMDEMLVPCDYLITVKTQKGEYKSIFRIKPKTITWEGLSKLKEYLESVAAGIIYDIYKNRSGVNVAKFKVSSSILDKYKYILEAFPKIQNVLNILIKKRPADIKKVYKITRISKRQDIKSQRWLMQKGIIKNQNIYMPDKLYEKHTQIIINTIENQWLKTILMILGQVLEEIGQSFDYINRTNHGEKNNLEIEKLNISEKIKRNKYYFGADDYIKRLNEKNIFLNKDIKKIEKKILATQKDIREIDKMLGSINYYLNETWIKEVEILKDIKKPTIKLQKDKYYSIIYNFYRKINQYRKKQVSENEYTFPYRPTAKLYEYYVYFIVIEILNSLGYEPEESILDNSIKELTPGTKIKLVKDDHYIILTYDEKLEKYPLRKDISYFEPNQHDRPDIRLAVYKKDNEFIAAMILEVKCRRYRNMYKKDIPTNTMIQVRDYLKIGYFDKVRKEKQEIMNVPNPIKQVIVVYPQQDEGEEMKYIEYDRYGEQLVFLQLGPANMANKSYGYGNLEKLINGFLGKWIYI